MVTVITSIAFAGEKRVWAASFNASSSKWLQRTTIENVSETILPVRPWTISARDLHKGSLHFWNAQCSFQFAYPGEIIGSQVCLLASSAYCSMTSSASLFSYTNKAWIHESTTVIVKKFLFHTDRVRWAQFDKILLFRSSSLFNGVWNFSLRPWGGYAVILCSEWMG